MPYEVWIDLTDPAPQDSDDVAREQRPDAILELIEAGWESGSGFEDKDASDPAAELEDQEVRDLLDVRVLTYPARATIGLALDTDDPVIVAEVGISLAHHLAGTPTVFGWRLTSLRTDMLAAPLAAGMWLPPANQPQARFPVAAHLPEELQHLCSHYLLVAAARRLTNPNDRYQPRVDAADLVSGSIEHPWGRELVSALGGLLVAAARAEAATSTQHPLLGRGGGDPALAQALLDSIRKDQAQPATGYDDGMRGHVLVEQFMTDHNLTFNQVDTALDPKANEYRSHEQLRSLLWAGIRTLATLGKDTLKESRSPWLWLAELDSDDIDAVVNDFAERDDDFFEEADEQAENELTTATYAHLLVRIALLHPNLVTDALPGLDDTDVTGGPLHHVAAEALMSLGTPALEFAARTPANNPVAKAANALLPALRAIDADEDDALNDLHAALEKPFPDETQDSQQQRRRTKTFLDVIASAAAAVGPDRATDIARRLLIAPDMTACVIVDDLDDRTIQDTLRLRILAEAAALDPTAAGSVAAHLPALRSDDPRDEPALRIQTTTWWNRTINALRHRPDQTQPDLASYACPEPGATLLSTLSSPTDADSISPLATMPTPTAAVAVVQAISTLSIALHDPNLPYDIIAAEH